MVDLAADVVTGAWRRALEVWGVRMHAPARGDSGGAIAAFRFPTEVVFDPARIRALGVEEQLTSVFAHELGHHVVAPATRIVSARILIVMRDALDVCEKPVANIPVACADLSNLWTDLLVNTRLRTLQRARGVDDDVADVYRAMKAAATGKPSRLWQTYIRTYEILWHLDAGDLVEVRDTAVESDARQLAMTVRTFQDDPVGGALPAGLILAPLLNADDSPGPCAGEASGRPLTPDELREVLAGLPVEPGGAQALGIARTLELFPEVSEDDAMRAWYENLARRHRVRLRARSLTGGTVLIPGPHEEWEPGDDLATLDVRASAARSPRLVPGVTTVRRTTLTETDPAPDQPLDLDLYIDASGSMPNAMSSSPAMLAAVVLIDGVLSAGGRVRVTTFSGPGEVRGTAAFGRDRSAAIAAALRAPGGGTTFPLDLLHRRYARPAREAPHVVVLSDDGLRSMFGAGQPELAGVAAQARTRMASATLVLVIDEAADVGYATDAGYRVERTPNIADVAAVCAKLARDILEGRARR